FLLKAVKNYNRVLDSGGVDPAVGIAPIIRNDFDGVYPFHRRSGWVIFAKLGLIESLPNFRSHRHWKCAKFSFRITHPMEGLAHKPYGNTKYISNDIKLYGSPAKTASYP